MPPSRFKRVYGVVLVASWVPYLLTLSPPEFQIQYLFMFALNFANLFLGLFGGVLLIRNSRFWRPLVIVSAAWFLLVMALDTFHHLAFAEMSLDRLPTEFMDGLIGSKYAFALRMFGVDPSVTKAFYLYHLLVMPVIQIVALALAILSPNRVRPPQGQPSA